MNGAYTAFRSSGTDTNSVATRPHYIALQVEITALRQPSEHPPLGLVPLPLEMLDSRFKPSSLGRLFAAPLSTEPQTAMTSSSSV
jgi:hypothetical protein